MTQEDWTKMNKESHYNALQKQDTANRKLIKKLQLEKEELKKQLALYGVVSCFKMEVHSKNGAWYEIVLAKTDVEAHKKVITKYPHNTGVSWIDEYPEPIF